MEAHKPDFDAVKVRDNTLKELERKIEQRRQLDKEISGLRVALNGLNVTIQAQHNKYELDPLPLDAEYEGIRKMGLTDAVRKVLANAPSGMTPKDVRQKLESLQYKKLPASNPLAAIHGIFTRLEKAGEIEPTQPDKKAYRWIPEIERFSRFTPVSDEQLGEAMLGKYKPRRPSLLRKGSFGYKYFSAPGNKKDE